MFFFNLWCQLSINFDNERRLMKTNLIIKIIKFTTKTKNKIYEHTINNKNYNKN